jgi:hypothetical protein
MKLENGMKSPSDATYLEKTAHKSNLIIEARIFRETGRLEEAARNLAEAGRLEEELQRFCLENGFEKKSFVHAFSAVHCWLRAGDSYHALTLCEDIFKQEGLTERLKKHTEQLLEELYRKRKQYWDIFHKEMMEKYEAEEAEIRAEAMLEKQKMIENGEVVP